MPTDNPTPSVQSDTKASHWFVQVVGGVTLANTIVSALAIFYVFMAYTLLPSAS